MESIRLGHVPSDYSVYAAFFKDISNAEFLQSQLVKRNPEFEYAFIDASSVN
jgi:EKC/KEOPS complex subunit CGI121/TPRKB